MKIQQDKTKANTLELGKKKKSSIKGTRTRPTHLHTQEHHKNVKLEDKIQMQWTLVPTHASPVSIFDHADVEGLVLRVAFISSALTLFLPPILQGFLTPKGRDLVKTSCLELSVPRSVTICIVSDSGSLYLHQVSSFLSSLVVERLRTCFYI